MTRAKKKNGHSPHEETSEPASEARWTAVEIEGWPALGGKVRLDLGERRTVLVGRNGSGKSALLEALALGSAQAFGAVFEQNPPSRFVAEVGVAGERVLRYELRVSALDRGTDEGPPSVHSYRLATKEECWRLSPKTLLWRASAPRYHDVNPVAPTLAQLDISLRTAEQPLSHLEERRVVRSLLRNVSFVPAGLPRAGMFHTELILKGAQGYVEELNQNEVRMSSLVARLARLKMQRPDAFEEVEELCGRLRLLKEIGIDTLGNQSGKDRSTPRSEWIDLRLDGVNVGLVADGTLRVLEILVAMVDARPSTLVLLDEPELGIHPGLLGRLLSIFDSYSFTRQLIVTTQADRVVSWARPEEVRLVDRDETGRTRVRALTAKEVKRVAVFLDESGTLADFVYGGSLDAAK